MAPWGVGVWGGAAAGRVALAGRAGPGGGPHVSAGTRLRTDTLGECCPHRANRAEGCRALPAQPNARGAHKLKQVPFVTHTASRHTLTHCGLCARYMYMRHAHVTHARYTHTSMCEFGSPLIALRTVWAVQAPSNSTILLQLLAECECAFPGHAPPAACNHPP